MIANNGKLGDIVNFKPLAYSFRSEDIDTGDFITYDAEKCNRCGDCVLVCALGFWTLPKGKKARLSAKYREHCLECAACYAMCEQDAIDFRYPNGGTGIIIQHG